MLTLKQLCVEILKHKFGKNNVHENTEKNCCDITLDLSRIEITCLKESYHFYENLPMSLNGRIIRWYLEDNFLPSRSEEHKISNIIIEAALLDCKGGKKCSVARHYAELENENFIKAELLVDIGSITWELLMKEIRSPSYR